MLMLGAGAAILPEPVCCQPGKVKRAAVVVIAGIAPEYVNSLDITRQSQHQNKGNQVNQLFTRHTSPSKKGCSTAKKLADYSQQTLLRRSCAETRDTCGRIASSNGHEASIPLPRKKKQGKFGFFLYRLTEGGCKLPAPR